MEPFKRVDEGDLRAFRDMLDAARVFSGDAISEDYAHDEMTEYGHFPPEAVLQAAVLRAWTAMRCWRHFPPEAVLQAASIEEISRVLAYCNRSNIAVTPRGAGTGLCGGCVCVHGGIVLSLEKMNRVIEIDRRNMTATVEPGVLLMEFAKHLQGTGLSYPPDPGEKTATLGGNVMTNAGGMRAVRYGVTRDYVLGMRLVLASGEVLTLGGKMVKSSSGYSLIQLLCGSEGTLGVLAEVTLRLVAEPASNLSVLAPFPDLDTCTRAVPQILALGIDPTAVEFMEREVIEASETYLGKAFPDNTRQAYLLVRLDGASVGALQPALDQLTDLLLASGADDVLLADTEERKASIWDARGAFLEAISGSTPSMDECDVVVPRDQIARFMAEAVAIGQSEGVRVRSFGHAGDGNLHIYACKDEMNDDEWALKRQRVMDRLYQRAHNLGGQMSGEHGVGHAKRHYLRESLGDTQIELMRGIKRAFDPNGILNPGKVV